MDTTFNVIVYVEGAHFCWSTEVGRGYCLNGEPAGDTFADTVEVALLGVYGNPITLILHK